LQDCGEPQISISFAQQKLTEVFHQVSHKEKGHNDNLWAEAKLKTALFLCSLGEGREREEKRERERKVEREEREREKKRERERRREREGTERRVCGQREE
jgi:hypothetical protein